MEYILFNVAVRNIEIHRDFFSLWPGDINGDVDGRQQLSHKYAQISMRTSHSESLAPEWKRYFQKCHYGCMMYIEMAPNYILI